MGTLPVEKLRDYAAEYGAFVGTIDQGWETIGETHYAEEEREHEELWAGFQLALGSGARSQRPQTETLVTAAGNAFGSKPEAIGALYAFEAQQPNTAQTKLEGLREHYNVGEAGEKYFVVHANDFNEVEDLKVHLANLSDAEFERAKTACAVVCSAMYGALDGVYYTN